MNSSTENKTPPVLPRHLFWDVKPGQIDWEKHARFVISRVMHRGNWKDWEKVREFYGDTRIKEIMPRINWQDPKTKNFFKFLYK